MTKFKISLEIELESDSPLNAAKEFQGWLRKDDWQYYVQNESTKEIFSIDLQEEDENAVLPVTNYEPIIN